MSGPARDMTPDEMRAEIWRLSQWVHDIQSGMFINCVYCGHRYGPKESTGVAIPGAGETMAEALARHVMGCAYHPMAKLAQENAMLREQLAAKDDPILRQKLEAAERYVEELDKKNADLKKLTESAK